MPLSSLHTFLNLLIASVWLVNGLWCNLLDRVPRHRRIVARVLGETHSGLITKLIGAGEILLAIWILTGLIPGLCAAVQIFLILTMNLLEFFLAPDLLLFGKRNALLAALLIAVILANAFLLGA